MKFILGILLWSDYEDTNCGFVDEKRVDEIFCVYYAAT
jgi:hypothetical protein